MKLVSTGKTISSPEFYKKLKRKKKVKLILFSSLLLIALIGLVILSRYDKLLIKDIAIADEGVVGKSQIIESLEEKISGNYLWIFPRRNAFIYPRWSVEDYLLASLPRFKSASVHLSGFNTLNVEVVERESHAVYCLKSESESCYFMDEEGFIFDISPSFTRGVYFVYYQATTTEAQIGTHFVSKEEFTRFSQVLASISELGIEPVSLEVRNHELSIMTSRGTEILWPRESDPAFVYSNLEAFLNSEIIKAEGDFLGKIIYLDLMTTNKIFYRFRE